jgi:hypothetical protein
MVNLLTALVSPGMGGMASVVVPVEPETPAGAALDGELPPQAVSTIPVASTQLASAVRMKTRGIGNVSIHPSM